MTTIHQDILRMDGEDMVDEIMRLRKANSVLKKALGQFTVCNLTEQNCASFDVANKRIRNIARAALARAKGEA